MGRDEAIGAIKRVVGPKGYIDAAADMKPYTEGWIVTHRGSSPLVVRPASTQEVAEVVKICARAKLPITPQGGHTGLCGGATPQGGILLSLNRMNQIREIDPVNYTMTVDAGCVLEQLQKAAEASDRYFPLSLAAEGSCTIGGNLSTNAGGTNTLRYGNARDLCFGVEVVLPDGTIWDGLRRLRKDNTGYDLRAMFMGAEGTLGIITAAVLKLYPKPRQIASGRISRICQSLSSCASDCAMVASSKRPSSAAFSSSASVSAMTSTPSDAKETISIST